MAGDLCPGCDEEFVNCTCPKNSHSESTTHSREVSGEDVADLYDGWYDPGK